VDDAGELCFIALPRVDPASLHFDLRRICTTELISVTRVNVGRRAYTQPPCSGSAPGLSAVRGPGLLFRRPEAFSDFQTDRIHKRELKVSIIFSVSDITVYVYLVLIDLPALSQLNFSHRIQCTDYSKRFI
jgi:hypothetical protein